MPSRYWRAQRVPGVGHITASQIPGKETGRGHRRSQLVSILLITGNQETTGQQENKEGEY